MNKTYAVIAALPSEVEVLRKNLTDINEGELLGSPVFDGILCGNTIAVMQCGMGKVSAACGTQALIDRYSPDYIINSGCAGGIAQGLKIGDVVISDSVVEWDLDLRAIGLPQGYIDALKLVEMKADKYLADRLEAVIGKEEKVIRGTVVSGDQFVSTKEQREFILSHFPEALCAEMEGAAVGHVCMQNKIPFCVIRTMSDTADHDSTVDYAEFAPAAGRKSAAHIVGMLKEE